MVARRPVATGPIATLPNTASHLRVTQIGIEVWRSTAAATTLSLSIRNTAATFGRPWPGAGVHVAIPGTSISSGQLAAQAISATNLRTTQIAVETWFAGPSNLRATQVGVELWRSTGNANPVNLAIRASGMSAAASTFGFAARVTLRGPTASFGALNLTGGGAAQPVLFVNV